MIYGIPNRPLYFYQKDIIDRDAVDGCKIGQNPAPVDRWFIHVYPII